MIKVAVTGAAGRMGSGIIRKITEQDDMEVVAAIEMPNTPLAGTDAGERAGVGKLGVPIVGSEDLEKALKESGQGYAARPLCAGLGIRSPDSEFSLS